MKKYVVLKCSVCARKRDSLIDLTHYTPDLCTITLNCEGRLVPTGFTNDAANQTGVPPEGLSNWYPRGSNVFQTQTISQQSLFDIGTGSKRQLVVAVSNDLLGINPSPSSTLKLNLIAERQTTKDYRQYTFRRSTSFTIINGVESNQAKKVLRYTTADSVDVYLNGVKKINGVDYLLNDGTPSSACPQNSVLFTSTQTGSSNQVDVVVSTPVQQTEATLTFSRSIDDESRVNLGAWEGVDMVSKPGDGDWSLFYCDFSEISSAVALDTKFILDSATITDGIEYLVERAAFLISRSNLHTAIDRNRSKWIPLNKLSGSNYLITKLVNGTRTMLATEEASTNIFPVLEIVRFKVPSLVKVNVSGDSDASELDNNLIIGPDS